MKATSEPIVPQNTFTIELNQDEADLLYTFMLCTEIQEQRLSYLLKNAGAKEVPHKDSVKGYYIDWTSSQVVPRRYS